MPGDRFMSASINRDNYGRKYIYGNIAASIGKSAEKANGNMSATAAHKLICIFIPLQMVY